ncbi:hypothetical protein Tco_0781118 [Tanacetum coccineum]
MDSIILIGQKNTRAEYMILSGADNHPSMLDKDLYDSLKSRMELYMKNREHEIMILESVEHGPLIWPTIEENRSCQGSMGKNSTTNARQQATIHDGRVTVQLVQGRQISFAAGMSGTRANISGTGGNNSEPGIAKGPVTQMVITHNAAYQADDLDAYDSDCGDFSIARAVLMANLSRRKMHTKNIDKEIALEKKVKELDNIVCKMGQFAQTVHMLTKPQVFYDNNLKQALGFQNLFYLKKVQHIRPMLYDGSVIAKETNVISIADSEETLMLEEESRSKMLLKQSDPMVLKHKVTIKPVNYVELNRLSNILAPRELPKKQFLIENNLLLDQIIYQDIVNIVVNSSLDLNTSVNVKSFVAMNDSVNYEEMYNKCLELEVELIKQHNMVEKDKYIRLLKSFSKLKQHCISLELAMQLNKDIFQKNNTFMNQTEPLFDQLFELNNLKAKIQAKDRTIEKLKANIKHLNKTSTINNVKKGI